MDSLTFRIIVGLVIGKQLGVFGATWLAIHYRWAPPLAEANRLIIYGVAVICGVGFTMSLFIGNLAFANESITYSVLVRVGVLTAVVLSGITGYWLLRRVD